MVGSNILDVGAGTERLAIPLYESGYSITAIDASNPLLDVLRSKGSTSRIHTIHARLQDLALKDQFDFVCYVLSVFCYLTTEGELDAAIDAICRHTKPTGKILVDVTALGSFTGINYQSEDLIRTAVIEQEDPIQHLCHYSETAQKSQPDGIQEFKDDFLIKYWDHGLSLNKFAKIGFGSQLSMTHQFVGSGARYFLLGKR